jgi:DNA polymerase III delta prime subunit
MVAMDRPSPAELRKCIHAICGTEGFVLLDSDIDALAAQRDVRQAITQLQLTDVPSPADERLSPFHVTQRLFSRSGKKKQAPLLHVKIALPLTNRRLFPRTAADGRDAAGTRNGRADGAR